MKSRVVLFLVFIAASAIASERWWSPDKFYSITPPADWKDSESHASDASSSYAFKSPEGDCEVRISATYRLDLPEVLPDKLLELAFPDERGIAPIQKIRGKGWDGLRREYIDTAHAKHWLGVAARRGSTAVLLTMRAPEKEFERYRATFEAVLDSLQLGQ